jgi:hypothetical protein
MASGFSEIKARPTGQKLKSENLTVITTNSQNFHILMTYYTCHDYLASMKI